MCPRNFTKHTMATILSPPQGVKERMPVAVIMSTPQLLCCLGQVCVRECFALFGRINLCFKSVYLDSWGGFEPKPGLGLDTVGLKLGSELVRVGTVNGWIFKCFMALLRSELQWIRGAFYFFLSSQRIPQHPWLINSSCVSLQLTNTDGDHRHWLCSEL